MAEHYVVEIETSTTLPTRGLEDFLDHWVTELQPWHGSVSGHASHAVVTITLPAESLDQAIATGLAVVRRLAEPLVVQAQPEKVRDARQGWVPIPQLLSVTEAAERLGVSRQRVQQMIDEGKLAGEQVGRSWVIPAPAVEALAPTSE